MLRSALGWLRHSTPELHSTHNAGYCGVEAVDKLNPHFIASIFWREWYRYVNISLVLIW